MFVFSFPGFTKFCRHNAVKFIVLREVIHKRQDHIAEEDQPLAGACVADMRRLLVGDIQALAEDFPVSAGLVQKVHKIAVFKDILDFRGGKQVLDVLRDPRGDTAPFTKAFPNLHAPRTNLTAQQKVELQVDLP